MKIRVKEWHESNEEVWAQSRPLNMVLQQASGESKGRRVCRKCGKKDSVYVVINGWTIDDNTISIDKQMGKIEIGEYRYKRPEGFVGKVEIAGYCTECDEPFWGEQYWVKKQ